MQTATSIHRAIDARFELDVSAVRAFLRIPSLTASGPQELQRAASWVGAAITDLGGHFSLEGAGTAPMVVGEIDAKAARTLLVYGMYDVQPVDGQREEWQADPFAASILDLPDGIGPAIVARGACNSKGPLAAFLNVLAVLRANGGLPVNLKFLIEGREEEGSPGLAAFVSANRQRLAADAGFEPFWADYGLDVQGPTLGLGSKGISVLRLQCNAGDWGGPAGGELHSSVSDLIGSPAWQLLRGISTLVDSEGRLVPSLQPSTTPSAEDARILATLANQFDLEQLRTALGARQLSNAPSVEALLRSHLFTIVANPSNVDIGTGDVVPREARCDLVLRLPPSVSTHKLVEGIRSHLAANHISGVTVTEVSAYPGSRTPIESRVVQSLLRAYKSFDIVPQIWPFLASGTPYFLFSEILGIPYVYGGLGKAGRSHSPNEYVTLEGLKLFEKSLASFLIEFGQE